MTDFSHHDPGTKLGEFLIKTGGVLGNNHFLRLTALRNWINLPDIVDEEKKYMVW